MCKSIFFFLLFSLFANQSAAAQANEPTDVVLPAIELEGELRKERASENKTTITKKDLELRQTQTLADALRHVEGVTVINSGGPGRPSSVFIRGSNADHVLILIDGVETNDLLSPSRAASLDQVFSDEVERIEVLRGPQTLRYGPSALNGIINIITKKGSGAPKRLLKAQLGKYNTSDAVLGLSGGEPDSNYDIRYSQFHTDGFSSANVERGNQEADGASQSQVSGRFGATPVQNLDLDLSVRYVDTFNEIDRGGGANQDDPDFYTDTRKLLTSLKSYSTFDLKFIELDNLLSVQRFDRVSQNNSDLANPATIFENYHGQLFKASSNISLNWTRRHSTVVGVDFKEDRGRSNQFSEQSSALAGVFASHTYSNSRGLFYDFGARADRHLTNDEDYITTQNGIGFAFTENTRIRIGGGTSIKQPSLFQLYSTFGNSTLKTERGTTADVTAEHSFAEGYGKLSTSVFYHHFEELIDVAGLRYANVGEAETYGADFVARTPIGPGILLGGTYTLLRTKSFSDGRSLLRRPNESATADLQLNISPTVQLLHSTNFVGVRDDLDGLNRVALPHHFVSRLVLNYQLSQNSSIYTRLENLYDRKFEEVAGYGTSRRAAYLGFKTQF